MMFTLATSAKEWLRDKVAGAEEADEEENKEPVEEVRRHCLACRLCSSLALLVPNKVTIIAQCWI
jgi:Fe-S oxidoreductase